MTAPAPAATTCPGGCGQDVIRAGNKTLDAQPDLLGIHRPDGTWQTAHDKIAGRLGYHTHRCPGPQDVQQELFA